MIGLVAFCILWHIIECQLLIISLSFSSLYFEHSPCDLIYLCPPFFLHSSAGVFLERWGLFFICHWLHTQGKTLVPIEVLVKSIMYLNNIGAFYTIPCSTSVDVIFNLASCFGDKWERGRKGRPKNSVVVLFKMAHTSLVLSSANHVPCLSTLALDSSAFATASSLSAPPGLWGPHACPLCLGGHGSCGHIWNSSQSYAIHPLLHGLPPKANICPHPVFDTHCIGEFGGILLSSL